MGKTAANGVNGLLRNTTIDVPLKYLRNFGRLLEMTLINCKVELKLKSTNYCILFTAGADYANGNSNNIIFTIKDTKLYVPLVTLPAKGNQKLSKPLSKGYERSVYWNEFKTKTGNKNTKDEYKIFSWVKFRDI